MEFFGNKLCISARTLIDEGFITESCYRNWVNRGRINVVRRGGGAAGNYALVAVDSLPTKCKEKVEGKYPGGNAVLLRGWIISNYELDQAAVAYFMDWAAKQHSNKASAELAQKYAVNASVLNTCHRDAARGVRPRPAGIDTPVPQKSGRIQTRRLCLPDKRQVRQPECEEGGP